MFLMFKLKASVLRQFDDQNSRRNTSYNGYNKNRASVVKSDPNHFHELLLN